MAAVQVRQSFAASLKNLQTDYIDSFVLHSPMPTHEETMEVWRVLEDLHEQGRVRQLGISNIYEVPALQRIWRQATIKPAVVQNRFYRQSNFDKGA